MDQGKRLTINTLCNALVFAVNLVSGFVLAPYLLHHLGKSTYGVWALTGSLLAYSNLLALGLNSAVNRWVPMYLVRNDHAGINRVVNTTVVAYLVAAGVIAAATVVLMIGFPVWFRVPQELSADSRLTVGIVGVGFMVLFAFNVFRAVLSGRQRYDLIATSELAAGAVRIAGIVALLVSGMGLVALAVVSTLAQASRGILTVIFARRTCPEMKIRLSEARWSTFREMIGYSINTLVYSTGQIIQQQAAVILIGVALGTAAVTEYAMPLVVVGVLIRFVTVGSSVLKPAVTHLDAQQRQGQVQRLYLISIRYALLISIPLAAFTLTYSWEIMGIWLKEGYVGSGDAILRILVVGALFRAWRMPAFFVVVGLGKHRLFGVMTLVTAVSSLLLGAALLTWTQSGIVGVAVGFTVPQVLISTLVIGPYCSRAVGLTLASEVRRSVLPAAIAMTPMLAILAVARYTFSPTTIAEMLVLVGVLAVPTVAGWWWLGFSAEERARFIGMLPVGRVRSAGDSEK